jgi:hypothetical protein
MEEMARDQACWDEDMVATRRSCEIHELATVCHHRTRIMRHEAARACMDAGLGSNTANNVGWVDTAM